MYPRSTLSWQLPWRGCTSLQHRFLFWMFLTESYFEAKYWPYYAQIVGMSCSDKVSRGTGCGPEKFLCNCCRDLTHRSNSVNAFVSLCLLLLTAENANCSQMEAVNLIEWDKCLRSQVSNLESLDLRQLYTFSTDTRSCLALHTHTYIHIQTTADRCTLGRSCVWFLLREQCDEV